ncbi:hypothetical protein CEXT_17691 [Caerostris extrusa]|uniref:Uncharacterized protein n=1 Tax=Caerostris extrusa TaxID=172846 RepID=A0AAV4XJA0_CAEEX|nr:hypothetical protein CEXT_17691 [Caerostris extrusa]
MQLIPLSPLEQRPHKKGGLDLGWRNDICPLLAHGSQADGQHHLPPSTSTHIPLQKSCWGVEGRKFLPVGNRFFHQRC